MNSRDYDFYFTHSNDSSPSFPFECSIIQVPAVKEHSDDLNLTAEFDLEVHVYDTCSRCYGGGSLCEHDKEGNFQCAITERGKDVRITHKFWATYTCIENAYRVLCICIGLSLQSYVMMHKNCQWADCLRSLQ